MKSRRKFIQIIPAAPLALMVPSLANAQIAMVDPNSQNAKRLMYKPGGGDPIGKRCGVCAAYRPINPNIGNCAVFKGGVTGMSVCAGFKALTLGR